MENKMNTTPHTPTRITSTNSNTQKVAQVLQSEGVKSLASKFEGKVIDAKVEGQSLSKDELTHAVSQTLGEAALWPHFSYFDKPISNLIPRKDITIPDVYKAITGHYLKAKTERANSLYLQYLDTVDKKAYYNFKKSSFGYCTFSGIFSKRNDKSLIKHSGLYCMDIDETLDARRLIFEITSDNNDPFFETELCFKSMSSFGVKWIISLREEATDTHENIYKGLQFYFEKEYGISTDNTSDVSRACFLSYDPKAYINPKYGV